MGSLQDEPLTPLGRVFLQKQMVQVVHFAIGTKYPIDNVEAMKVAVKDSIMANHLRFCSTLVRNARGVDQWRKTEINIDRHFIVIETRVGDSSDDEAAVNEYLADMSSPSSFDETKPLWEIHVLKAHKCIVLRIHHALGDGTSLMSMLLTLCRQVDDPDSLPTIAASTSTRKPGKTSNLLIRVWFSVVFILGFLLRSVSLLFDRINPITGGDGVELWPRKLATARFRLNDIKFVKRAIPGATINDVLIGVISAGLSRYMDLKSLQENCKWPSSMRFGTQMTGVSMVNIRKNPGLLDLMRLRNGDPSLAWGNQFGIMLLPVYTQGTKTNPLDYIVEAKAMLDRKKSSFEAAFSYWIGDFVTTWFGPKLMSYFLRRIICGTTFSISNMVGPQEPIGYLGNPILYVRASITSLPHSLTMHMVTYGDRADLQILVAKDIIPDPEFLAGCFEDALNNMKATVGATHGSLEGGVSL